MASITFDISCVPPEFVRVATRRAAATPDGSPIVRARRINQRVLRSYQIEFSRETPWTVIQALNETWRATKGPVIPMNFTPPGESEIEVRFKKNSKRTVRHSILCGSASVELEEVH